MFIFSFPSSSVSGSFGAALVLGRDVGDVIRQRDQFVAPVSLNRDYSNSRYSRTVAQAIPCK
jgi:hypothetical protein